MRIRLLRYACASAVIRIRSQYFESNYVITIILSRLNSRTNFRKEGMIIRINARRDCGRYKSSESLLSVSCNLQLLYAEDPKLSLTYCFIDESPTDRVRRARGAHLHR
jgi:hypothetical protein